MTVIHFETESDNSTLQENIRAITPMIIYADTYSILLIDSLNSTNNFQSRFQRFVFLR